MRTQTLQEKIKQLHEIEACLEEKRAEGCTIVQCHGVFDLLHIGHVRHLQSAKQQGDILIVSVTPDRFVNKGPGRPAFTEVLRLEALAALEVVDYVVLNDTADAISVIQKIKPDVYVKGVEYQKHDEDVTGKISAEADAVTEHGGRVFYTDDIVFSSSNLLNAFFDPPSEEVSRFLAEMKQIYTIQDLMAKVEALSQLKVLVVGDAILDEYQYTEPLGQSGKGIHMAAKCLHKEVFLGGALIVASHVAQFAGEVTLLSAIGGECPYEQFIATNLDSNIETHLVRTRQAQTLVKKRYVLKEGKTLTKLFETYSSNGDLLGPSQTTDVVDYIRDHGAKFDLVLVADFGNGFTNPEIVQALSRVPAFLAVNTQTNSGNRGYNVITHYPRADFISLNEPEIRLAAHDRLSSVEAIAEMIRQEMAAKAVVVTRGVNGVLCHWKGETCLIPALVTQSVDRVGAGDSFLAIASLAMSAGLDMRLAGFLGAVAAALSVQIVGNQEPIRKAPFCKFLTRLMK